MPAKECSLPIGSWIGITWRPRLFCSEAKARSRSARSRSILVKWTTTGSSYSAAISQAFSVFTSTPATALTQSTAASAARKPARISEAKMP